MERRFKRCCGRRLAVGVLAACVFLLVALGSAQTVQTARASSSATNRIDLRPGSAPVGSQVDVSVTLYTAPSGQQLQLTAAPWDTAPGCPKSVPIAGVAPFDPPQSLPAVMHVQIMWPATLAHGQYVVCALATGDNTAVALSFAPFIVDDGSLTPTPTTRPEQYPSPGPAPTIIVMNQANGFIAGSDIRIAIDHWAYWSALDSSTQGQMQVMLFSADASHNVPPKTISGYSMASRPPDSSLLTLTLPPDTTPGNYLVIIAMKGAIVARTPPFSVVAAAPTLPSSPTTQSVPPGMPMSSAGPTPILLLVAAVLALAVSLLLGPALARRLRR